MKVGETFRKVDRVVKTNSPEILTGMSVTGTLLTAYLTAKATLDIARSESLDIFSCYTREDKKNAIKRVWKRYIPAAISGVLTIGCTVSANKLGSKKTAAAYSLLAISERAFDEYKDKVVEQIGEKKEQAIRDEIAQDRVSSAPAVIVGGSGTVLCYEMHTGRYFNADMETLRRAENLVNAKLLREDESSLSDFYYLVGLPTTSYSSSTGWRSDRLLEIRYSTTMSDDSRPCLAFEYNYVKAL